MLLVHCNNYTWTRPWPSALDVRSLDYAVVRYTLNNAKMKLLLNLNGAAETDQMMLAMLIRAAPAAGLGEGVPDPDLGLS